MSRYAVSLEVSGPLAMWARADTGGSPTSGPVPSWGAAKGLLESIAFMPSGAAWFDPQRVEMCRRKGMPGGTLSYQRYATNYNGPLRKEANVKAGVGMQVFATALKEPCYRLHAAIRGVDEAPGINSRHHLQDLFKRRIRQGRCFRTPALGWKEFTCDYWGEPREGWETDDALNLVIPSMLHSVWDREYGGQYRPQYVQDAAIVAGVLIYAQ